MAFLDLRGQLHDLTNWKHTNWWGIYSDLCDPWLKLRSRSVAPQLKSGSFGWFTLGYNWDPGPLRGHKSDPLKNFIYTSNFIYTLFIVFCFARFHKIYLPFNTMFSPKNQQILTHSLVKHTSHIKIMRDFKHTKSWCEENEEVVR